MFTPTIAAEELREIQAGRQIDLIDVRTPAEFGELHAAGSRNLPLDELNPRQLVDSRNGMTGQPLYLICRTGSRANKAREKLLAAGCTEVFTVAGGVDAWVAADLPVVRGQKAMSLERQVRVTAGFFVLLGAILAYFVNIHFVWLAAFFGAGLMFAGLTDTCGMAMLLAKLPWNRRASGQQCSA